MTASQDNAGVLPVGRPDTHAESTAISSLINPVEIMRIAWEGIVRNKIRSLLTMLGVIIGVAAVIIMIAISAGTEATIAEQIQGLGANLVFIQSSFGRGRPGAAENTPTLVYDDVALVATVPGVVGTAVEMPSSQTVKADGTSLSDVQLLGTTPDYPSVREVPVADGRFLSATDMERKAKVAVLGPGIAKELFGTADPIGQTISVGTLKLAVIGITAEKGTVGNTDFDNRIYVPITLVFDRLLPSQFARFVGNRVQVIYAQIDEKADIIPGFGTGKGGQGVEASEDVGNGDWHRQLAQQLEKS